MEVSDNKVGVVDLPVKGRDSEHDSGKAGDQTLKKEADAKEHGRVEEVGTEIAVEHQHDLRRGERADSDEDQSGDNGVQPGQQRHAGELHAGAAHTERGSDEVDRRRDGAYAAEQYGERPVVCAVA